MQTGKTNKHASTLQSAACQQVKSPPLLVPRCTASRPASTIQSSRPKISMPMLCRISAANRLLPPLYTNTYTHLQVGQLDVA